MIKEDLKGKALRLGIDITKPCRKYLEIGDIRFSELCRTVNEFISETGDKDPVVSIEIDHYQSSYEYCDLESKFFIEAVTQKSDSELETEITNQETRLRQEEIRKRKRAEAAKLKKEKEEAKKKLLKEKLEAEELKLFLSLKAKFENGNQ